MKVKENVQIAYIGGGSRGWAWGLMSDLAQAEDISGEVRLYDIDKQAAYNNEIIGNKIKGGKSEWKYVAKDTIGEALTGADFVVISILPGTFDEMESDVHLPEKYGIYQAVGDTSGPGGIIRSLRTIPMYEEIALAIKEYSPNAWVINYTNPMTVCVATLYKVFPEIKAFGCCHEVFSTQNLLLAALKDIEGIEEKRREEAKVNVVGVNHFTWLTAAKYKDIDLFPVYRKFVEKYYETGYKKENESISLNNMFRCRERVKFDLFLRYGAIAAAGDRHLAEFCPGDWYLKSPQQVDEWLFGLTPVSWRKDSLVERLEVSEQYMSGEKEFVLSPTGEDGVKQIRALLGLEDLITNVNIPNLGQIPNMPIGAVVETNAYFTADSVQPIAAGNVPASVMPLVGRIAFEQECVVNAGITKDLDLAFGAFASDPLVRLSLSDAKTLFDKMIENTSKYLTMYK